MLQYLFPCLTVLKLKLVPMTLQSLYNTSLHTACLEKNRTNDTVDESLCINKLTFCTIDSLIR